MLSDKLLLSFGESLLLSAIGMCVVLLELAILAVMIIILSKVLTSVAGGSKTAAAAAAPAPAAPVPAAAPAPAPAPVAPVAPVAPAAPVRPAGLVLENVDEATAAMVMAIVSARTEIPLNHLNFHSIKGAPVVLEGLDDQTAAAVMAIVSKESGVPLSRLSFNSIKKVD